MYVRIYATRQAVGVPYSHPFAWTYVLPSILAWKKSTWRKTASKLDVFLNARHLSLHVYNSYSGLVVFTKLCQMILQMGMISKINIFLPWKEWTKKLS